MPEEVPTVPVQSSPVKKGASPMKGLLVVGLAVIFVILGFFLYSLLTKNNPPSNKVTTGLEREEIKLGWTSLQGIYPNYSTPTLDDFNFNDSIFEALTKVRSESVVPGLATKWTNPSPTIWRFTIRPNVAFQSGDKLTAEDVKYSFDKASESIGLDEEWPSTASLQTVKEVQVIDSSTVEIETTKPDPLLLNRITGLYILSKTQIERDTLAKAVGTGPYKVVSFEANKEAVVGVNESYWGNRPKVKKATFSTYDTDELMVTALKKGEIDYARLSSANQVIPAGFETKKIDEPRVVMLFFNFLATKLNGEDNPLLKEKIRQAVRDSLDKATIIKEASASGIVANQFLTKAIVGYNSSLPISEKNISAAKALLKEAGIENLSFTIYSTADRENVAKAVAKQLSEASITVSIKTVEGFGDLVKLLQKGEAAAFIASPSANDGGEYIDGIFRSEADQNIFGYSNSEVDTLADKANKNFKPAERRLLLEELVAKIMADNPVIPLYSITDTFVIRDNFDFKVNYLGDFSLESVSGRQVTSGQPD